LFIERLLQRLWPLAFMVTASMLVALSGLPAFLPAGLHLVVLAGLAAALTWQVRQQIHATPRPSCAEAERRIEAASGLRHHPYATVIDHPALGADDAEASRLWQLHREQALIALVRPQRAGWPHLPQALRQSLPMLATVLTVAVLWTGAQTGARLAAAVTPDVRIPGLTVAPPVAAWLEPPAYTGQPSQSLPLDGQAQPPAGTVLRVMVQHSWLTPRLHAGTGAAQLLEPLAGTDNGFTLALPLTASGAYRLTTGLVTAARWDITLAADGMPRIALREPPQPERDGTVRLSYAAQDDYGVVTVWAILRQAVPADSQTATQQVRVELARAPEDARQPELAGSSFLDLTAHPWAGSSVTIQLEAVDAIGQFGQTPPVAMTLPERHFTHPVARQLAGLRKQLLQDFSAAADPSASQLAELLGAPADLGDDLTAYLALRVAYLQILRAAGGQDVPPAIPPLLWETALRLETTTPEGADARVRQAEETLRQALENPGSTPEEIQQAFTELTEALQDYLNQLQNSAAFLPPDTAQNLTGAAAQNLNDMLQALQQMAMRGDRDQARQALDALKQLTDALRQAQADPERAQQTLAALQELAQLAGDQAALSEALTGAKPEDLNQHGKQQDALQQRLQALQGKLAELGLQPPPSLDQAGKAMQEAARALTSGAREQGEQQAATAADLLAGGMDQMLQSLQQGGTQFLSLGQPGGGTGRAATSGLKVPDDPRTRLRQILDTLRARANDPARPPEEREYLRRLLDVF
jgi:uncharacterized protein (TIGR02302 family)